MQSVADKYFNLLRCSKKLTQIITTLHQISSLWQKMPLNRFWHLDNRVQPLIWWTSVFETTHWPRLKSKSLRYCFQTPGYQNCY